MKLEILAAFLILIGAQLITFSLVECIIFVTSRKWSGKKKSRRNDTTAERTDYET